MFVLILFAKSVETLLFEVNKPEQDMKLHSNPKILDMNIRIERISMFIDIRHGVGIPIK